MLNQPTVQALVLLLCTLFGSAIASAGTGAVLDNGDFFSDSAKKEATRKIAQIETQFKKDLVIETFTTIPDEIKRGVDLTDKTASSKMFEQWAVEEAKRQNVNGIYVLLSSEPAHLHIAVDDETQNTAFSLKERDSLVGLMLSKLRSKQNDEALSECVNFVSTKMESHSVPGPSVTGLTSPSAAGSEKAVQSEQATPWSWIIIAVVGVGAIWLILGVIRSLMAGRGATAGPGMGSSAGGGGMFSSLLGGMFGAAAGMWIYDQFSGSNGNALGGEEENRSVGSTDFSGQDTGYSGTGGDFGGSDSGGDGGGGDF